MMRINKSKTNRFLLEQTGLRYLLLPLHTLFAMLSDVLLECYVDGWDGQGVYWNYMHACFFSSHVVVFSSCQNIWSASCVF